MNRFNSELITYTNGWRMEASRWCKWSMIWLILTAIPLCAAMSYVSKQKSSSLGCFILAVFLVANYVASLAALTKVFVKEKT